MNYGKYIVIIFIYNEINFIVLLVEFVIIVWKVWNILMVGRICSVFGWYYYDYKGLFSNGIFLVL